jgi:hypothetical protein
LYAFLAMNLHIGKLRYFRINTNRMRTIVD